MKQPVKGATAKPKKKKKTSVSSGGKFRGRRRKKGNYGTSKLETYFAHNFLDKMGLKYVYEYEAKDIKRFYDFAVTAYEECDYLMEDKNGIRSVKQYGNGFVPCLFIEVDGGFFHSDPRIVDQNNLNPMQKHNKFVDRLKDEWCAMHCIPLLRFWEEDIKKNPKIIFEELEKYMGEGRKRRMINENWKKPH